MNNYIILLAFAMLFIGCVQMDQTGTDSTVTTPEPPAVNETEPDISTLIDEPDLLDDPLDAAIKDLELFE